MAARESHQRNIRRCSARIPIPPCSALPHRLTVDTGSGDDEAKAALDKQPDDPENDEDNDQAPPAENGKKATVLSR